MVELREFGASILEDVLTRNDLLRLSKSVSTLIDLLVLFVKLLCVYMCAIGVRVVYERNYQN